MPDGLKTPKYLYHFTSPVGLTAIFRTRYITLTESNLNTYEGSCDVLWLTSSPHPGCHGLKFDTAMPAQLDKTSIRITLSNKKSYKKWEDWSSGKGMDKDYKKALISSANAEETHKTWYISETEIPVNEFIKVENLMTGEIIIAEEINNSLPDVKTSKIKFINEIDAYIASQPANLQVLLLSVRMAIKQALPNATEKISWQMPTFWQGRNLIHFATQKNHLGIYPGPEAIKHFIPRLSEYKTSKGAIQFPYKSFGAEQITLITEIAAWCEKNAK